MIVIGSEEVAREPRSPRLHHHDAGSHDRTLGRPDPPVDARDHRSRGRVIFGVMPGAMDGAGFGAKLVSVFRSAAARGRSHQGAILPSTGSQAHLVCVVDAGEVTAIRTACASAAATDALARPDATCLAILGTGEQAWQHALAMSHVRPLERIVIWGRSEAKAHDLGARIKVALAVPADVAESAAAAAHGADIICTATPASEPILLQQMSRTAPISMSSARATPARPKLTAPWSNAPAFSRPSRQRAGAGRRISRGQSGRSSRGRSCACRRSGLLSPARRLAAKVRGM